MSDFGKRAGGGRRTAQRHSVPLIAVFTSLARTGRATLHDLSSTGARLSSANPPGIAEDLLLIIDAVRAFGSVLWINGEEFGVQFDPPLQPLEVAMLRRRGSEARGLSAEMKAALDTWMGGSPR